MSTQISPIRGLDSNNSASHEGPDIYRPEVRDYMDVLAVKAGLLRDEVSGIFNVFQNKVTPGRSEGEETVTRDITIPLDENNKVILAFRTAPVSEPSGKITVTRPTAIDYDLPYPFSVEFTGEEPLKVPGITDSAGLLEGAVKISTGVSEGDEALVQLEDSNGQYHLVEPGPETEVSALVSALTNALNIKIKKACPDLQK